MMAMNLLEGKGMQNLLRAGFIFIAALLLFSPVIVSQAAQIDSSNGSFDVTCSESPRENRLDVVAPMAGTSPVWVVDGAYGKWQGPDKPVKTAWVVARNYPGDLVVTGRRLDGPGHALFKNGAQSPVLEELKIPNAHRAGVVPGGASSNVIREYAFHPSYLIYPSPGCWELVADLGDQKIKIIIRMTDDRR